MPRPLVELTAPVVVTDTFEAVFVPVAVASTPPDLPVTSWASTVTEPRPEPPEVVALMP